mgnify:FL=1
MTPAVILIIISLLFSFFFSGMEVAFVSSNKVRIDLDAQNHTVIGRILTLFTRHQRQFITTLLVGNNIALVIFGISIATLTRPLIAVIWDQSLFIILGQTIVATIAILLTSEFLSNALFRINPNFCLRFFAIPTFLIYIILYPITRFSTGISDSILRLSGIKIEKNIPENSVSIDELDQFLQQSIEDSNNDQPVETEVKILQNALEFSTRSTRECMIPRPEIIAVNIDETSEHTLIKRFTDTGFSKLLVYKDNIDHIIGYIHSSDLFKRSVDWKTYIRPITQVAETMPAQKLMKSLMQQKKSIAVVVNEYGGTAGIITLEDLVEEIFGDIEDEHDTPRYFSKKIDDRTYEFSGRMEISKINEIYHLDLPESDEYLTIAGYILHDHQTIPQPGETVENGKYSFEILDRNNSRIGRVRMRIAETDSVAGAKEKECEKR